MFRSVLSSALIAVLVAGCGKADAPPPRMPRARDPGPRPDELPALVNAELPFRYPAALYARKVQGNVTLKLFIDRDGRVLPDSTRIDEPSGFPALDTAAIKGSQELHFVPAKLHGEAIPISLLFPVYFRHPEARPLPGDTILRAASRGPDGV
jgi:TonB family protein